MPAMMTITDYLAKQGSDASVSEAVGLDRSTISRIRRGLIDPPLSTVERIVSATGGRIVIEPPRTAPAKRRRRGA